MRLRSLALAALLSTTCITKPVEAGPVLPFLQGVWAGLTTGAAAGAGIGGAFAMGMNTGAWLVGGSFLSRVVVSIGMSALAQSLAPKPQMPTQPEIMANYAQDVAWQDRFYGRVRKGGPFCLAAYSDLGLATPAGTDKRRKRHYGILIGAHSTRGPVHHYLDKLQVAVDGNGWVLTDPIMWRNPPQKATDFHGWIRAYTGQASQTADPTWRAAFPEVSEADNFAGLSYAAISAARPAQEHFQTVYPGGREWAYAPVWDGYDRVYDPRTNSRIWTNNAALIIADVAEWYGKTVVWDEVAVEADISDQLVINRSGGLQKRWTINTVLRSDMTWEQVRAHLMMCCDAWFYERPDGRLGFKVGAYSAPTLTLTDQDFAALSIKHKAVGPDEVGSFALRYVEPARDWNSEVSGAVVLNPVGDRSEEECNGVDSHNQAWRIIWRWARAAQPEWQISGTLKFIGYECIGQRFLRIQHGESGLDCIVEVALLARNAGSQTWQIEAASVSPEDFDPDALVHEPPRTMRAAIEEDRSVAAPESLTGQVVTGTGGVAMFEYEWPEQPDDLRQQLQYRSPEAGIDWQIIDVGAGQVNQVIAGLVDGKNYEAQLRNRTGGNRVSEWVPEDPLVLKAVANSVAPGAMRYFNATVSGSAVGLSFIPPNDPVYAATRIWRALNSSNFADAAIVGIEYGAPNLADEWTDPSPGVGTHSYWLEPLNGSGIPGPRTLRREATII